jgi:hypothetical protein
MKSYLDGRKERLELPKADGGILSSTARREGRSVMCRFINPLLSATFLLAGLAGIVSADGGWSWRNPLPTGAFLQATALIDANIATVVGSSGTILRTTDGGFTWTQQPSGTQAYLNAVSFTDASNGTAVGNNGTILRTTDGGHVDPSVASGVLPVLWCLVHRLQHGLGGGRQLLEPCVSPIMNPGPNLMPQYVHTGDEVHPVAELR